MPHSLLRALIAHFDSVFEGPNGDYSAVLEDLASISAAQALWKPAPSQNSIWQIVEHLIASKEWEIEMLERGSANSPAWVEPSGNELAWQATLARLTETHQMLKMALQRIAETDLLESPAGETLTLLELVLSSGPAHEAHHSGQIDYLKGLQAATGPD
jgi:hypothetical protein